MIIISDKPKQFQVHENTIYVLTEKGKLYKFYENYEKIFLILDVDKVEVSKKGTEQRGITRIIKKLTKMFCPRPKANAVANKSNPTK